MTYSLATKLMIVNVSIAVWEGRKLDRGVTDKTLRDNNISEADALRVNKLLISKDAFKEVQAASSAIRNFVRDRTLPWKDNGDRALMRQGYQLFMLDFSTLKDTWTAAVDRFVGELYPAEVAKATFRLADAYDANDYPHPEELRGKFRLTLDIDAVAEPDDFRVTLDQGDVEAIQASMKDALEQRVHAAMKDVWSRVATMVDHYVARTSPDIQRFHDTTVTNMQELVGLMPSLNLIGDPDLKALTRRLKATLCQYDPKDLRKDKDVRAAANAEAAQIMEDMKGFMSAFGA